MSAARWSLRLPRTNTHILSPNPPQNIIRRVDQRRWLRKPPQRARPWASTGKANEESDQHALERTQNSYGASQAQQQQEQQPGPNTRLASTLQQSSSSDLVTEVRIPDDPNGVLPPTHPAYALLSNSSLVIQRQMEFMNLMMGFEQANKYIIMNGSGETVGYIAEQDHGIGSAMMRQVFKTHRSFTTHIFDREEREVLRIHRPFAYVNSRIRIYDPIPEGGFAEMQGSTSLQGTSAGSTVNQGAMAQVSPLPLSEMRIIGEAQQRWAPLRRKYELFSYRPLEPTPESNATARIVSGDKPNTDSTALTESKAPEQAIEAGMSQFASINEAFLSWDFTLRNSQSHTIGSVNRNFAGFAREIFTDTGVYALRMDSAAQTSALETEEGEEVGRYERVAKAMTLDQRAVMLATAVSVDFDYFSRHSGHATGGGFMPIFWPMGGGAAEGGTAGAGAGAAGAGEAGALEGAAGAAGRTGTGAAAGESAIAGAGTMAGYEAMQRGAYGPRGGGDDASPQANDPYAGASPGQAPGESSSSDAWGESKDPWGSGDGDDPWGGGGAPPSAGGEGGDGGGSFFDDIF